jgi:hypothetical protein
MPISGLVTIWGRNKKFDGQIISAEPFSTSRRDRLGGAGGPGSPAPMPKSFYSKIKKAS